MTQKVRVGVIGTSWYTDLMHYPTIQSHSQAELVAICGRNQERAKEIANKYGGPNTFSDYQEMIKDSDLDAIIIATPDDLHYEMTMYALDAGLHVLCEKPLAMNAQQAWEMYQMAESVGVKHMTYFTYRWMPFSQYVHHLIAQSYIGNLYHCEFRFQMDFGRSQETRWRFDNKRSNGMLGDLGSHMVDLARWLVGDITSVMANMGTFVDRQRVDGSIIDPANDSAFLLVQFANGANGIIQASAVTYLAEYGSRIEINLYGEAGTLEISICARRSEVVIYGARSQDEQFQTLEVPERYWGEADPSDNISNFTKNSVGTRQFIDAILDDRPVEINFYQGFKAQQVVDAALKSHDKGCAVNIDNSI